MGPGSTPRFLADDMVARLGRWLRVVGCDTLIWRGGPDEDLLAVAGREGRVVLTRDTGLAAHAPADLEVHTLTEDNPVRQLVLVARRFGLDLRAARYTRCQRCNGPLRPVPKERHRAEIPPRSFEAFDEFWRCESCGHLYWPGDHFASMEKTLAWVEREMAAGSGPTG